MSIKPTVFIVDDDATVRNSLTALIQSMGVDSESFDSAEAFLAASLLNRPGCVVTDLRMMGMSGIELQEELTKRDSTLPVIILTAYASIPVAVKAVKNGAVTFLEKTSNEHDLWKAIKEALGQNEVRQKIIQERRALRELLATLTDDERKVLELIADGQANKQVALTLDISLRTVESRRHRVMNKLGVESFAELIRLYVKAENGAEPE